MHDRGSAPHIALVKLSSLGDVVHALPAARAIRAWWPRAELTWVVERREEAILAGNPDLSDVVAVDTRLWRREFRSLAGAPAVAMKVRGLVRTLAAGRFDAAVDLQGLWKSGVITAPHACAPARGPGSRVLPGARQRLVHEPPRGAGARGGPRGRPVPGGRRGPRDRPRRRRAAGVSDLEGRRRRGTDGALARGRGRQGHVAPRAAEPGLGRRSQALGGRGLPASRRGAGGARGSAGGHHLGAGGGAARARDRSRHANRGLCPRPPASRR